jgi:hypothetical protein
MVGRKEGRGREGGCCVLGERFLFLGSWLRLRGARVRVGAWAEAGRRWGTARIALWPLLSIGSGGEKGGWEAALTCGALRLRLRPRQEWKTGGFARIHRARRRGTGGKITSRPAAGGWPPRPAACRRFVSLARVRCYSALALSLRPRQWYLLHGSTYLLPSWPVFFSLAGALGYWRPGAVLDNFFLPSRKTPLTDGTQSSARLTAGSGPTCQ